MARTPLALALIAALATAAGAAEAAGVATHNGVNDRPFLELMGRVEGPEGYNQITMSTRLRPNRPLVQLTIREVLAFQRQVRASGANSSAMGRYQFNYQTLKHMVDVHGIDPDLRFDSITQDALARIEMRRCGFYAPIASDRQVADCLAAIWAALPLTTGPNAGRSRYQGVNGNRALVSTEAVLRSMRARFSDTRMAQGN